MTANQLADALEKVSPLNYPFYGTVVVRTDLLSDARALLRRLAAVEQAARRLVEAEDRLAATPYDHKSVGGLFIRGQVNVAREALRAALAALTEAPV
jgi:hypothetical protein